ncbi:carboxypeptidase regulatory-like domain-containing protein [Kaustia mangrovi]|uniref:Carboxypeptidase regulatory-like domain-containing protein n=1 Tax=Kaustia mangrovi TaxID=2593653 RepID=A0A7S8C504_9HYPH|nr:carboxypeptidase-like regulatory domain-containing protein [Kaustia mangrovi]QPC43508.1 carboxypeptidase regulatory-like domain-containing protein [Kaustia mangrovi]
MAAVVGVALLLGGCVGAAIGVGSQLPDKHVMTSPFDARQVAHIHQVGDANIEGVMTVPDRYDDKSMVPPAGSQIRVYPDSPYAREWIQALFGDRKASFDPIEIDSALESDFKRMARVGRTDKNGRFRIDGIPAGAYFVVGTGYFADAKRLQKSALVYERVTLTKGQTANVALDGR